MDTNKLKRFATEARNKIRKGVVKKLLALGFDEKGEPSFFPQQLQGATLYRGQQLEESFYGQWLALYEAIQHHGVKAVYEEVAYTWFNRLVAIRILQKNGFIDHVLTFDNPEIRVPHIVSEARQGRFPEMSTADRLRLRGIISDPSKTYEQFSLLITAFCHDNSIISACFGAISDYMSLLLPNDILDADGFVDMLNRADYISDEDYKTTELLGWLYQFYISERKDDVFASFKKGHKAEADDIAPATQIFTPNWIVKYMVQNTLGRIWLDNNPGDSLENKMKYLVPKAEGGSDDSIYRYGSLEDIKVIDPACGSGHILLEAFDLLYDMYMTEFYSREEAITSIFTKNLIGIDLDTRAKQLATFALLLKACQRDKSFLDVPVKPRVLDMPEVYDESLYGSLDEFINLFCGAPEHENPTAEDVEEIKDAFTLMKDANTLGTIMKFNLSDHCRQVIKESLDYWTNETLRRKEIVVYRPAFELMLALTDKYTCVIANPPYMGRLSMNEVVTRYVQEKYILGKWDLFATFMLVGVQLLQDFGKMAMINMHSWMFLDAFEGLRTYIVKQYQIDNLLHLGPNTFDELSGEVVQNTSFVISKYKPLNGGDYYKLISGINCSEKEILFLNNNEHYANINQLDFAHIPGCPMAYWLSHNWLRLFEKQSINDVAASKAGVVSGDDSYFVRNWYEVKFNDISLMAQKPYAKYHTFQKGGTNRKYYGNNDFVFKLRDFWNEKFYNKSIRRGDEASYFKLGIGWSYTGNTKNKAFRQVKNCICGTGTPTIYAKDDADYFYLIGYLNSKIVSQLLPILNPTLSLAPGYVVRLPFVNSASKVEITKYAKFNVEISKQDWDAHETSWDFQRNPLWEQQLNCILINMQELGAMSADATIDDIEAFHLPDLMQPLEVLTENYKSEWEDHFMQLHANEEELNRQFISIYGLEDELTPDVPLNEITILQQGEISIEDNELKWHDDVIIKQFISYAIGCMMGRYSIDKPGLILANQGDGVEQYKKLVPNSRFDIDDDGIIPLMDDNSPFSDNAVSRLAEFVKTAFGAEHLTQNLNYMEQALGKSLSDYLQKDFWKDHKKMYQNRPIYWLFASKKGAFRALVYMHRMDAYTVGKVRNQYLLPYIEWLKQRIDELMAHQADLSTPERKQLKDFGKSLEECREYDVRLHEVANKQISIDLDDGVVVNYAKYGDVLQKLK